VHDTAVGLCVCSGICCF